MLILIVKSRINITIGDKDLRNTANQYVVVVYMNNQKTTSHMTSLVQAFQQFPKAHLTTEDKLQMVESVFKLTGETEGLDEYWKTL